MDILYYAKIYTISLIFIILVDFLWIKFFMQNFYKSQVGSLMSIHTNITAAVGVWMLLILGMLVFMLPKLSTTGFGIDGFLYGALFGFIVYGIYDLTNFAIINGWPLKLVFVDVLWGTFVCGLTGLLISYLGRTFL